MRDRGIKETREESGKLLARNFLTARRHISALLRRGIKITASPVPRANFQPGLTASRHSKTRGKGGVSGEVESADISRHRILYTASCNALRLSKFAAWPAPLFETWKLRRAR